MTYSRHTTRTITTPNKGSRNGAKITNIVLHHFAGTGLEGVLSMWSRATRAASCNYAIGNEGQIIGVVPEEQRSWSVANAAFDSKSITFEIENERAGDASGWPVSAAAHEATAQVVADVATRYGIPITRDRIIGHREVYTRFRVGYPTACPGGLNLDAIVRRAAEIQAGTAAVIVPAGNITPIAGDAGANKGIQKMLAKLYGYRADIDDEFGTGSWVAMQQFLAANWGYTGDVDGWAAQGGQTWKAIQRWLAARYGYKGEIDGIYGPDTAAAWARANAANWTAF